MMFLLALYNSNWPRNKEVRLTQIRTSMSRGATLFSKLTTSSSNKKLALSNHSTGKLLIVKELTDY